MQRLETVRDDRLLYKYHHLQDECSQYPVQVNCSSGTWEPELVLGCSTSGDASVKFPCHLKT